MFDLSGRDFAPGTFRRNGLAAVRLETCGGQPASLQYRALASRRSWRPLILSADGKQAGLFKAVRHLLDGGAVDTLPPVVVATLWQAGVLLFRDEQPGLPEDEPPEVESVESLPQPWLPPEEAGARLWRRLFPDFDSIIASLSPAIPAGVPERFACGLPVFLPGLLSAGDAAAAAALWRRLATLKLPRRLERGFAINNDPLARAFLRRLTPTVETITGRALRESYSFAMYYEPGAWLRTHFDRLQCEYTMSLFLDYHPAAADGRGAWALEVETAPDTEPERYYQAPGDAALFCGRRLPHSRPPLPEGHHSLVLMLHWVDADFPDAEMDQS